MSRFDFKWDYDENYANEVCITATCHGCGEEFKELYFNTPNIEKISEANMLNMDSHCPGCEIRPESIWNKRQKETN